MRFWLLPACIALVLMAPEVLVRLGQPDSAAEGLVRERMEAALNRQMAVGDSAGDHKDRQRGVVRVSGTGRPLSEDYVQRAVAKRSEAQSAYVSVWNWQGIPEVTASARGLDKKHHFANSYLVGFRPFKTRQLWVPLYTLAIRKKYQRDHLQYAGLSDIWQTSRQAFYQKRGDCEDHAILLADWLIELGIDARVAMGTHKGQGHAWVVAIVDDTEYLLEATSKRRISSWKALPLAALAEDYDVEFQFNRHYFWALKDNKPTRKYRGSHWVKKSQFIRS
ncbi:transglutaminase-like domain-containing protein [Microbulbifer halophilus]|uniref:Transglutaminase domain-containing protein n=1 Tax=Microbulbifer halophilus TaxID=453963 RepID=A0ABW5EHQ5_9GAMM|nr:transglutaminase-like domain-containing protein [Microbulbifer halophilus]MCW8127416.1 transglutaminase-like domain-containing protein [Microbulbifer halophilus]